MTATLYIFASIGALVVFAVAAIFSQEIYRAIRQSYRIAYVSERMRGHRGVTAVMWWCAFKYELTSLYTSLQIGSFEIPRNYKKKIRRNRHW